MRTLGLKGLKLSDFSGFSSETINNTSFSKKAVRKAIRGHRGDFRNGLVRMLEYGQKVKDRRYKGRYMPIACGIGKEIAKMKGFSEREAKAIGYAFALMPNILRNSKRWGIGIDNGVFVSRRKVWGDNDDKLVESGEIEGVKQVEMGNFNFYVKNGKVCSPRMRTLIWWTERDFDSQMMKLSKEQREKMFWKIKQELKELNLSPEILDYKIAKQWGTFFQVMLERVGDYIYN